MMMEKELTWDELPVQVTLQKQRACKECLLWINAGDLAVVVKTTPFLEYTTNTYQFQKFYHLKCWLERKL
jgi:hypothetical protein